MTALVVLALTKRGPPSPNIVALAAGCGLLSILWMPLYPQLMFKPQTRVLEVSQDGVSTTIGRCSARRSWREIRSVSQDGDYVILSCHNGNAFIVPPRAFQSADDRQTFLTFARRAASAVPAE